MQRGGGWAGAAVDAGRACRVLLVSVCVNHSASSPDVQPVQRKDRWVGTSGLGCSGVGAHGSGRVGMGWDGREGTGWDGMGCSAADLLTAGLLLPGRDQEQQTLKAVCSGTVLY